MKEITQEELNKRMDLHREWLTGSEDDSGVRLVLIKKDLSRLDFSRRALNKAVFAGSILSRANFTGATLTDADLCNCSLVGTNFKGAATHRADLTGADIDFVSFDLACRTTGMHLDIEQIRQMLYSVYNQECTDPEFRKIQSRILPYVKRWDGLERHGLSL